MSKSTRIQTRAFQDKESLSHRVRKAKTLKVLPLAEKKTTKTSQI